MKHNATLMQNLWAAATELWQTENDDLFGDGGSNTEKAAFDLIE